MFAKEDILQIIQMVIYKIVNQRLMFVVHTVHHQQQLNVHRNHVLVIQIVLPQVNVPVEQ